MANRVTYLVVSVDAVGHVNACRGVTRPLVARGHRVVFFVNHNYAGKLSPEGFEEYVNDSTTHFENGDDDNPGAHLAMGLEASNVFGPYNPEDKNNKLFEYFLLSPEAIDVNFVINQQVETAINIVKPDVIIVDQVFLYPAIFYSGKPWIRVMSFAPLYGVLSTDLPPPGLGLAYSTPKEECQRYRYLTEKMLYSKAVNDSMESRGYPRYPDDRLMPPTQSLSVYAYPEELNYPELRNLGHKLFNLEVFNKKQLEPSKLCDLVPQSFIDSDLDGRYSGKMIYLSMGSMGSVDLKLMTRLVDVLKHTPHKYIVSTGPRHREYQLAPRNMWGQAFLPQVKLLAYMDLVITHGGNNTFTETFAQGKVMLVMPLFGDQYDNAQRLVETGYGAKIDPYRFTPEQLITTIDSLLNDQQLRLKMNNVAARIAAANLEEELVKRIESIDIGHPQTGNEFN